MKPSDIIHFRLNKFSPQYILEEYNLNFRYVRLCALDIPREKMAKLFGKSGYPDQTPHSAASDLGLHCLPVNLFRVSRLKWVNKLVGVVFPEKARDRVRKNKQ